MDTVKITNTEFVRDLNSKAVLNTDVDGLRQFQRTRDAVLKEKRDRMETKERLRQLEQSLTEIKQLLADIAALKEANGNQ